MEVSNQLDETCPTCIGPGICPVLNEHKPVIDFTNSLGVLFDDCLIDTYFSLKWIYLSTGLLYPYHSDNWSKIRSCTFRNRGLNMCGCDYYLGYFRSTDFPTISKAYGMNGLNNQLTSNLCLVNNWNMFDNTVNCLNTANLEGMTWFSPLSVDPTSISWTSIGSQTLSAKYFDPAILNQVTNFGSCPVCSDLDPINFSYCYPYQFKIKKTQNSSNGSGINISPIPAIDFLFIDNSGVNQIVKIFNLMGEIQIWKEMFPGKQSIDITKLSSGIYFLQTEELHSYKFIKM